MKTQLRRKEYSGSFLLEAWGSCACAFDAKWGEDARSTTNNEKYDSGMEEVGVNYWVSCFLLVLGMGGSSDLACNITKLSKCDELR